MLEFSFKEAWVGKKVIKRGGWNIQKRSFERGSGGVDKWKKTNGLKLFLRIGISLTTSPL